MKSLTTIIIIIVIIAINLYYGFINSRLLYLEHIHTRMSFYGCSIVILIIYFVFPPFTFFTER